MDLMNLAGNFPIISCVAGSKHGNNNVKCFGIFLLIACKKIIWNVFHEIKTFMENLLGKRNA
jgi:hypothetical protein